MNIYKLRAFPKTEDGGNKAGVVLQSDNLKTSEMQFIAEEIGYSETAFVSMSRIADFKVRFFTPTNEVNLCGHATIATFNLMRDLGVIIPGMYTQETKAGILKIRVKENEVYMQQNLPMFSKPMKKQDVMKCFINLDFMSDELPIVIGSTGLREIFLPVKSVGHLNNLKPFYKEIMLASMKFNVIGIHAFALGDDCDAYGRNFAPIVGIKEESATGTSNGALGCYLAKFNFPQESFTLRQGYSMNQPSEIYTNLTLKGKNIVDVWVGGTAKIISE